MRTWLERTDPIVHLKIYPTAECYSHDNKNHSFNLENTKFQFDYEHLVIRYFMNSIKISMLFLLYEFIFLEVNIFDLELYIKDYSNDISV